MVSVLLKLGRWERNIRENPALRAAGKNLGFVKHLGRCGRTAVQVELRARLDCERSC